MKSNIKILSVIGFLVLSQNIFSQQNVGIMTDKPQEKVHISGPSTIIKKIGNTDISLITPTIRIDGVSMAHNPTAFSGPETTSPLYVDGNGDTTVKRGLETFGTYTPPGGDAITTGTTLNITANQSYHLTGNLLTVSFTLRQRSIVNISSTLTAEIRSSSGGAITDGKARSIAALLWFTSAPASSGISTASSYMSDGTTFASRASNSMNSGFKFNPSCEVVLPAGNYTIVLRGAGIASNNSPGDNYRVIWGGGSGDKLNVFARPL